MANCTECINLVSVIEGIGEAEHKKHTCTKYKVEVQLTAKAFKDRIVPCKLCMGKDYVKKI